MKVEVLLLDAGEGDFDFFVMLSLNNHYSVSRHDLDDCPLEVPHACRWGRGLVPGPNETLGCLRFLLSNTQGEYSFSASDVIEEGVQNKRS
jgi:hypothetical protein